MEEYSIVGRVIDHDQEPVGGLTVLIYHKSEITHRPHEVGATTTDADGRFELTLDPERTGGLSVRLKHPPQLHLVLKDATGRKILTSRSVPIDWQLEYRVYLGGGKREPTAPDLYRGVAKRMMAEAREAHMGARMKQDERDPAETGERAVWLKQALLADPSKGSGEMSSMLFAVTDGATTDRLIAPQLQTIELDGPQVPRRAWAAPDDQVIIWPRRERFRWG